MVFHWLRRIMTVAIIFRHSSSVTVNLSNRRALLMKCLKMDIAIAAKNRNIFHGHNLLIELINSDWGAFYYKSFWIWNGMRTFCYLETSSATLMLDWKHLLIKIRCIFENDTIFLKLKGNIKKKWCLFILN